MLYRGEKLYVTKDKRAEKRRSKLCWILCIGLVAAVIILGILAACKLKDFSFILILFNSHLAGAFKSDMPTEARQLGDKGNDTVLGASIIGGVPTATTTTTAQTTTTTTPEPQTNPPIFDESPVPSIPHLDEEITYGENN